MKKIAAFLVFILSLNLSYSQKPTAGYASKISGEDITYFSPFRSFANEALLTRCDGKSPIVWQAQKATVVNGIAQFKFLIGFSSGTSAEDRLFDVYLDDSLLFTFKTQKRWSERQNFQFASNYAPQGHYRFTMLEKDINKDIFGFFELELPYAHQGHTANFKIIGRDMQSRDWLMVFKYQEKFEFLATASCLVLRKEQLRPLNFECVIPEGSDSLVLDSPFFHYGKRLRTGYQTMSIPAYPKDFTGKDALQIFLYQNGKLQEFKEYTFLILPTKDLEFDIIHHSHNDIGYSHLQTEVAKIQTENIRAALRWIAKGGVDGVQPIWHIESLWAVENFMGQANSVEIQAFIAAVKKGQLVLSANYANCLTGLMRPEEMKWLMAYAKELQETYGIHISNAMVTDIPGQAYAAFEAYTQQQIRYLSLGPNYVQNLPDHGDRVGGVINETGDKPFLWQAKSDSSQPLFVWTAGKGYSYFHNIPAGQQFFEWEKRISSYMETLQDYPYQMVQLRYTKNADNGPVDTLLCKFVDDWNQKYSSPQLVIAIIDNLFAKFLSLYQAVLPKVTGEISPYWEDGAYSTAAEEIQMRRLVKEVIDFEEKLNTDQKIQHRAQLREIHRNLVLFHEHTWGAWCSISAPDTYFTTEQWRIKKAFLDSAQAQFEALQFLVSTKVPAKQKVKSQLSYNFDTSQSGIKSLQFQSKELLLQDTPGLGACIYSLGISPQVNHVLKVVRYDSKKDIQYSSHSNLNISLQYFATENPNEFQLQFTIDKQAIREKEALHVCLPFDLNNPTLSYGEQTLISYNQDQLPGSNKEFICVPDHLVLEDAEWRITIFTPDCNLIELGAPIDESQQKGAKVWKRSPQNPAPLYLYVFNNYWHTNYKADQGGTFTVNLYLRVEKR
ncbi:MAG: hypothetical protein ACKOBN_00060 [Flavobacteriales bacterium]